MSFKDILKQQQSGMEALATTGVIGLHLVSGPLVGFAIGYGLDYWLDTSPWCKLFFLLLGIAAGFLNVYRDTRHLLKKMAAEDARRKGLSPPPRLPPRQRGSGARAPLAPRPPLVRGYSSSHAAQASPLALAAGHRASGHPAAGAQRAAADSPVSAGRRRGFQRDALVFLVRRGIGHYDPDVLELGALFPARGPGRIQHRVFTRGIVALGRQAAAAGRAALLGPDSLQSAGNGHSGRPDRRSGHGPDNLCRGFP